MLLQKDCFFSQSKVLRDILRDYDHVFMLRDTDTYRSEFMGFMKPYCLFRRFLGWSFSHKIWMADSSHGVRHANVTPLGVWHAAHGYYEDDWTEHTIGLALQDMQKFDDQISWITKHISQLRKFRSLHRKSTQSFSLPMDQRNICKDMILRYGRVLMRRNMDINQDMQALVRPVMCEDLSVTEGFLLRHLHSQAYYFAAVSVDLDKYDYDIQEIDPVTVMNTAMHASLCVLADMWDTYFCES